MTLSRASEVEGCNVRGALRQRHLPGSARGGEAICVTPPAADNRRTRRKLSATDGASCHLRPISQTVTSGARRSAGQVVIPCRSLHARLSRSTAPRAGMGSTRAKGWAVERMDPSARWKRRMRLRPVPPENFEISTHGLKVRCSASELEGRGPLHLCHLRHHSARVIG